MPDPIVRITEYEVSIFPDWMRDSDDMLTAEESHTWALTVAYRGKGKWGVFRGRECLGSDGEWDWEPSPSSREDDWLETHRFDLETALHLAADHAPRVTINGRTAVDILAKLQQRAEG